MPPDFSIDSPIQSSKEDKFNRAVFAQKITSVCGNYTPKSTVVGVYGRWGEGKSSVLNMVSEKLDPEILQIRFNPWYFKDEEYLLLAYFKLLADSLGKKLHTRKEEIFNMIADYGESIGVLEAIPKVGKFIPFLKSALKVFRSKKGMSPEIARDRINKFIIESRLNLVIFIDDLDRLDSREVATIFKLVKLLGDFPRTTYILFFDPDIVARMLAPNYGGLVPDSGYQFLEKVIQLPLVIPKAHDDEILFFVQDAIQKVTTLANVDLETDKNKLVEIFADGLLLLLNNPRKIVRFSNSFQFTLLMLKGEVNLIDLIVLELFKANFPEYYHFIRGNKEMFLQDYTDDKLREHTSDTDDTLKQVNPILNGYPASVRRAIRELTMHLFPRFAWVDPAEAKNVKEESLIYLKKISSQDYFERYFTFSVKDDEIPDTHFSTYYIEGNSLSTEDVMDQLVKDIEKFSLRSIASKFAFNRTDIKPDNKEKIIQALCLISNRFEEAEAFDLGSPFKLLALSIAAIIRSLPIDKKLDVALEAVRNSNNLLFSAELTARFVMPSSEQDKNVIFIGDPAMQIKKLYLARLHLLMNEKGFFNAIPEQYMIRQIVWWHDVDQNSLDREIKGLFKSDEDAALKFLRIFTPSVYRSSTSSESPTLIKANFFETEYLRLDKIIGDYKMYKKLTEKFGDLSDIPTVYSTGLNDALDDRTLVGKFQELYKLKNLPHDNQGYLRRDD
ncbi:MAG TPA: P-loop NTPase fold protein [Chitinophagaceae bacterium]|nr:P-loop NTPase fold protein [Chitinophagaceae bacterium]